MTNSMPQVYKKPVDLSEEQLVELRNEAYDKKKSIYILPESFNVKLAVFDMDATVIEQESIVELSKSTGKQAEIQKITDSAMQGEIGFTEALKKRVAVLEGIDQNIFKTVLNNLTLSKGIKSLSQYLIQKDIPLALVSGGFVELANPIAERLQVKYVHANKLQIKNGRLTGQTEGDIVNGEAKAEFVSQLIKELGITASEVLIVGDGANDRHMLQTTPWSVGFQPKPILREYAQSANFSGDHDELKTVLASCF